MTAEPGRPAAPGDPGDPGDPAGTVEPAPAWQPTPFAAEIRAALRYERGLAVKAAAVLAALAVLLVLRGLYFALPAGGAGRRSRACQGEVTMKPTGRPGAGRAAGGDQEPAPARPRMGIRRWSTVGSLLALTVTAVMFALAVTAATDSDRYGHQLSGRLIPAAVAAEDQLSQFTVQQTLLRNVLAVGDARSLPAFRAAYDAAGRQWHDAQARLARLDGQDPPLAARADAAVAAYQAWVDGASGPQVAALGRGDFAAARALAANVQQVIPRTAAVRTTGLALAAYVIGEQQAVSRSLDVAHDTLLGTLIAIIAAVAAMAVAVIVGVRRGILVPLGRLRNAVAAVADGRYQRRIPAVGPAELADVSRGVEQMRIRLVAALAERERAESSLRGLFDLAPDAMLGIARDGSVVMANAQAVRLFGFAVHELVGRQAQTLVPEEWRADLMADTASYFTDRRSRAQWSGATAAGLRSDGTAFPAEVRLSLLPTDNGTVVIAAVRDVTERVALEAERERLRTAHDEERLARRQQQSQRLESIGQLVGGVAHDFNNLLNVISGYTDFTAEQLRALALGDERLDPVLADVEQVRMAAAQAIRLTRQLLTFAKSDRAHREVLDLNQVVDTAGQLLRRSLGELIELVVVTDPDLWRVEADRGQLEQVLVNLAVNARDAMPGGGRLTISTTNAEVDDAYARQRPNLKPGRYCWLAVSDTGTGMNQATIDRVFDPFFSTKPRGRGTGLGLATVYGIVSGLDGIIDVYSEVGLGTTINVLLPEAARAAAAAEREPEPRPGRAAAAPGQGETILIVEDEPSLRAMAGRILAKAGYRVCEAADGAGALRLTADPARRIDLLVTDMVMPGMLGTEVAERLRAARPGLPVLFTTGYAQQVLDFHGIPASELDIVHKPFTEQALLSRVRRALGRARSPGQPGPGEASPGEASPGEASPGEVMPRLPGPRPPGDERTGPGQVRSPAPGAGSAASGGDGDEGGHAPVRPENPD